MTIGEQLKKTRKMLDITQAQMCEGVVSESFYSKVERDKSRINAIDLIKILNNQRVSLYDFFIPFDEHNLNRKNINSKIMSAFNSRDIEKLTNIKSKIADNNKLSLKVELMIALLQNKVEQLPKKLRQEMHYNILQIGNWNKESLWELSIAMELYDFDELTVLVDSIFEDYSKIDVNDRNIIIPLGNIFVNYLVSCYKLNDLKRCRVVLAYIENVPCDPEIVLIKILGKYYQAKIDNNLAQVNKISFLLKSIGYKEYL